MWVGSQSHMLHVHVLGGRCVPHDWQDYALVHEPLIHLHVDHQGHTLSQKKKMKASCDELNKLRYSKTLLHHVGAYYRQHITESTPTPWPEVPHQYLSANTCN
jgi:hypothetical protein